MSPFLRSLPARALAILVVPAVAALSIGAGDVPDDARARLQNMSPQQRTELADAPAEPTVVGDFAEIGI